MEIQFQFLQEVLTSPTGRSHLARLVSQRNDFGHLFPGSFYLIGAATCRFSSFSLITFPIQHPCTSTINPKNLLMQLIRISKCYHQHPHPYCVAIFKHKVLRKGAIKIYNKNPWMTWKIHLKGFIFGNWTLLRK